MSALSISSINKEFAILQCSSSYPTHPSNVNLNFIKKLLENNVKRYSVIQIEEFLEVESGVIEKAETYFFGSNNVKQIRTFQRAYAYYNALLQVIEYEKTIGK